MNYKGFEIYKDGRKWCASIIGHARETGTTLAILKRKLDKILEMEVKK